MAQYRPDQSDLPTPSARKIGAQTVLLTVGLGFAQVLSFARNALLGHMLSLGDFGIAAALTITLQLVEMVSDIAADRMLVQADDGDDPVLLATAHTVMLGRGVLLAGLLYITGPLAAGLFGIGHAAPAFQALALVPLAKGFMHLDWRRDQRRLDNRPGVLLEIAAQGAALLTIWPALAWLDDYRVALASAAAYGLVLVATSHALAKTPWRLNLDRNRLERFAVFGWPVLLSAIPLIAVFQGDRIIVARFAGLEAFALYSAAFMMTLVPATLMTRIGQTLLLPLLTGARSRPVEARLKHYGLLCETVTLAAAAYLVAFAVLGDRAVAIAFGAGFAGQGLTIAAIALMWATRLTQMPVQALFLAEAHTKPLLIAGVLRAVALGLALLAAMLGHGLPVLALCGAAGEVLSLAYLAWRSASLLPGSGQVLVSRSAFLLCGAMIAMVAMRLAGDAPTLVALLLITVLAGCVLIAAAAILPGLRSLAAPGLRHACRLGRLLRNRMAPAGSA